MSNNKIDVLEDIKLAAHYADFDKKSKDWEQEIVELWKESNRGELEDLNCYWLGECYIGKSIPDPVSNTKPVYTYFLDELKDKCSWICAKCLCHERCPGFYYDIFGLEFDSAVQDHSIPELRNNPDMFESLKCRCECKQCKHDLDLKLGVLK
jgi:hypothetical protein